LHISELIRMRLDPPREAPQQPRSLGRRALAPAVAIERPASGGNGAVHIGGARFRYAPEGLPRVRVDALEGVLGIRARPRAVDQQCIRAIETVACAIPAVHAVPGALGSAHSGYSQITLSRAWRRSRRTARSARSSAPGSSCGSV